MRSVVDGDIHHRIDPVPRIDDVPVLDEQVVRLRRGPRWQRDRKQEEKRGFAGSGSWGAFSASRRVWLAGFEFSPRGDIEGRALLGYERRIPNVDTQAEFSGLVGRVDATFPLGNIFRLRGLFLRGTQPSVHLNNWFFVENRGGAWLDIYFAERWFVRPGAVLGTNTYPRASTFENEDGQLVTEIIEDEFQIYSFSVNYELRPELVLSVGVDQQLRSSNFPLFDKDRAVFRVGLSTDF